MAWPLLTDWGAEAGAPPRHVLCRTAHSCYSPEQAKNHASRREGDQRDAVAQGVHGLYQDVKRDLQRKKNHVCERLGPAGDTGTVPRSQTAAGPFTKGRFSLSTLGSRRCRGCGCPAPLGVRWARTPDPLPSVGTQRGQGVGRWRLSGPGTSGSGVSSHGEGSTTVGCRPSREPAYFRSMHNVEEMCPVDHGKAGMPNSPRG